MVLSLHGGDNMATTAQRIKEALELRQMKQADLAEKTGIGKSSISTYIAGEYNPKQKNLYKIAKALDVSETWLMGLDVPIERIDLNEFKKNHRKRMDAWNNQYYERELLNSFSKLNDDNKKKTIDYSKKLLDLQEFEKATLLYETDAFITNAASAVPNASEEYKQHDDDIMDDDF